MKPSFNSVEEIPPRTCYALTDDGKLLMMSSGVPSAWMRADLDARHVTSNTENNR